MNTNLRRNKIIYIKGLISRYNPLIQKAPPEQLPELMSEFQKIDPNLANVIKENGTNWIAFLLLKSASGELGILEISFEQEPIDKKAIGQAIRTSGVTIASMLDYKAHIRK